MADDNDKITARLDAQRAEIIGELREIKQNGKEVLQLANKNSTSIARIEGQIPGLIGQVGTNKDDIGEVRGWFIKLLMSSVASGGASGAIAAVLVKVLGG